MKDATITNGGEKSGSHEWTDPFDLGQALTAFILFENLLDAPIGLHYLLV